MIETKVYCDVCKSEIKQPSEKGKVMQVIFVTEQTEGRPANPYFSQILMDLCPECMSKALSGKYIHAHGAQGYNTFFFKNYKQDEKEE